MTTPAIIQDGVAYLDGLTPMKRVQLFPCPHCGKRFQRVKAHLTKSPCGALTTPAPKPEERCEVCTTKTGDLHEGHNGVFTGKWCCAACIAKDDELSDIESESDDEEKKEEPYVPTRSELIWAWLSANATEWQGKTARDIAWALSEDKHDVNQVLYADKRFQKMEVAGQSAPQWRCV